MGSQCRSMPIRSACILRILASTSKLRSRTMRAARLDDLHAVAEALEVTGNAGQPNRVHVEDRTRRDDVADRACRLWS